jgi:hypothetical protein
MTGRTRRRLALRCPTRRCFLECHPRNGSSLVENDDAMKTKTMACEQIGRDWGVECERCETGRVLEETWLFYSNRSQQQTVTRTAGLLALFLPLWAVAFLLLSLYSSYKILIKSTKKSFFLATAIEKRKSALKSAQVSPLLFTFLRFVFCLLYPHVY